MKGSSGISKRYPFQKSWRWIFVRILDFFLDFLSAKNQNKPFPKEPQRILVVRLDQIGDLVSSLPAFSLLKIRFPNADVTALVGTEGSAILSDNPYVDEITIFRRNWFSRNRGMSWREFFSAIRHLRRSRFDLGFDLRGDLRNILLMTLAGVRFRAGYGIAGGAGLLHRVENYDETLHQVELNAKLVMAKHIPKEELELEINVSADEIGQACQILKNSGADPNEILIAIHPEAGYPSKEWGMERFCEFIEKMLNAAPCRVLILGLHEASALAQRFSSSERVVHLVGKLSLRELIGVLNQCRLFVGNDSGPSHIAQALGIPAVVLASGTNEYERWGLWREPKRILKHAVPCAPCHLDRCNVSGHPCLAHISTDSVVEAAIELIYGDGC